MNCPDCNIKAFTKQTRACTGNVMRRRYQCPLCHRRFTTEESLRTTTVKGRDANGRFVRTTEPAPPRDYSNCCGGCNHWLHDGCALKIRTPSRARRFSAACDDWMLRYGPEAPPPHGRPGRLKPKQPSAERVKPVVAGPQPENFKHSCPGCVFDSDGKCDLGLPRPKKRACGSFFALSEKEAVA